LQFETFHYFAGTFTLTLTFTTTEQIEDEAGQYGDGRRLVRKEDFRHCHHRYVHQYHLPSNSFLNHGRLLAVLVVAVMHRTPVSIH
jgi:hypothetical protein